jgi:hypothetical protein
VRHLHPALAALLIVMLVPQFADAATGDPAIVDNWAYMDKCYRLSFDKFPDYTKEAAIKRRQFVRKCQIEYSIETGRPLILRQP